MTFRVSKYTWNSYKRISTDKNIRFFNSKRKIIFNLYGVLAAILTWFQLNASMHLHKKIIQENNYVKNKVKIN